MKSFCTLVLKCLFLTMIFACNALKLVGSEVRLDPKSFKLNEVQYATGVLDSSFSTDGKFSFDSNIGSDSASSAYLFNNGDILLGGYETTGTLNFALLKIDTYGNPILSFGTSGKVSTDFASGADSINSIAVSESGEIYACGRMHNGTDYDVAVAKYDSNGNLLNSFDTDGKYSYDFGFGNDYCNDIKIQSDGKIVITGYADNVSNVDMIVMRLNSDGTLDTSFNTTGTKLVNLGSGNDLAFTVELQPDSKILLGGYASNGANNDFAVVRLSSTGVLDTTFNSSGIRLIDSGFGVDEARGMKLLSDGKILLGGTMASAGTGEFAVVKLNSDGSLDTSFGNSGFAQVDFTANLEVGNYITTQGDGSIVLCGYANNGTDDDYAIVRFNSDGTIDTSFDGDGMKVDSVGNALDRCTGVIIQDDGKMLLYGISAIVSDDISLIRYK